MEIQQRLADLNTVLQENLVGIRVVKAFAREPFEMQQFAGSNQELRDASLGVFRMFAFVMPLIFAIANLGTLSVVWGCVGHEERLDRAVAWYRELLERAGATTATVD